MPPAETLVLVDLPAPSRKDEELIEELASRGPEASDLAVTVVSNDPLPAVDISETAPASESATVDSGDPAARAALFGRYTGQISARIERAWQKPVEWLDTTNVPASGVEPGAQTHSLKSFEDFKCQVRILQDAHGNVEEILLLKCNGTQEWQHSLIVAINQASPLPAPPSPNVFTRAVTLTFEAAKESKT